MGGGGYRLDKDHSGGAESMHFFDFQFYWESTTYLWMTIGTRTHCFVMLQSLTGFPGGIFTRSPGTYTSLTMKI